MSLSHWQLLREGIDQPVDDDDPGKGPSMRAPDTNSEVKATDTKSKVLTPERATQSLSLKDLCSLKKHYT